MCTRWHPIAIIEISVSFDDPRIVCLISIQVCVASNTTIVGSTGRITAIASWDVAHTGWDFTYNEIGVIALSLLLHVVVKSFRASSCELIDVKRDACELLAPTKR